MVFFVCQGCNESLKKNQVDKHAMKCRDCHAVACVDCQKTFYGNDYAAHTTCMSEAQRYQGALYQEKAAKANPQDAWNALIEEAVSSANNAPANIRPYLSKLADYGNVPRNQKKFANFASNSLRIFSKPIVDDIWKFLEALKAKNATPVPTPAPAAPQVVEKSKPDAMLSAQDKPEAKKEKKDKKAKKEKADKDEATAVEEVCEDSPEKKEKKSKKDKKRKIEEADKNTSEVTDSDSKKKKKKKHKPEE